MEILPQTQLAHPDVAQKHAMESVPLDTTDNRREEEARLTLPAEKHPYVLCACHIESERDLNLLATMILSVEDQKMPCSRGVYIGISADDKLVPATKALEALITGRSPHIHFIAARGSQFEKYKTILESAGTDWHPDSWIMFTESDSLWSIERYLMFTAAACSIDITPQYGSIFFERFIWRERPGVLEPMFDNPTIAEQVCVGMIHGMYRVAGREQTANGAQNHDPLIRLIVRKQVLTGFILSTPTHVLNARRCAYIFDNAIVIYGVRDAYLTLAQIWHAKRSYTDRAFAPSAVGLLYQEMRAQRTKLLWN